MPPKNAVSFFSGIDGIGFAAKASGFKTVCAIEYNEQAARAFKALHPGIPVLGDITKITHENIYEAAGTSDICLAYGGWPCQGNSVAGRRTGLADDRSGLWEEFARILECMLPAWIIGENVAGLLSAQSRAGDRAGDDYNRIQDDLAQMGYQVGWSSWRACDIPDACGDPYWHNRERVFTMACLGKGKKLDDRNRYGSSRWDALASHVRDGGFESHHSAVDADAAPVRRRNGGHAEVFEDRVAQVIERLYGRGRSIRRDPMREVEVSSEAREDQGLCSLPFHESIPGPSDIYGWMDVMARDPSLLPALEPGEEAESRFHGWVDGTPDKEVLRQVGNAVVPAQAWLVFQIASILIDMKNG